MGPIEIGVARLSEAPAIAALSRRLIEGGLPWTWTPRRVAGSILSRSTEVIAARDAGRLIGFAILDVGDDEAHLCLLGVDSTYQGHGVGRALMEWLESFAAAGGIQAIHLEVRATNHRARGFYKSLGFQETSLRRRYYSGVEDAVLMVARLRA